LKASVGKREEKDLSVNKAITRLSKEGEEDERTVACHQEKRVNRGEETGARAGTQANLSKEKEGAWLLLREPREPRRTAGGEREGTWVAPTVSLVKRKKGGGIALIELTLAKGEE